MINCNNSDKSGANKHNAADSENVPQKTAKDVVLEFMAEHDYPHQPKDIYGGLIYNSDITFSYRSVQVAVSDLADEGAIKRVQVDTGEGVVRDLPPDTSKRARYVITDEGRERLSE